MPRLAAAARNSHAADRRRSRRENPDACARHARIASAPPVARRRESANPRRHRRPARPCRAATPAMPKRRNARAIRRSAPDRSSRSPRRRDNARRSPRHAGEGEIAVETALDLDEQRNRPPIVARKSRKRRHVLARAAQRQARDLGMVQRVETPGPVGQPLQGLVMEDDDLAVGARLHVAFYRVAGANGGARRRQRVLDDSERAIVQASMRDLTFGQPG